MRSDLSLHFLTLLLAVKSCMFTAHGVQGGRRCTDGQALDASPDTDRCVGSDYEDQMPDGMHEAIQDAVSGAVNDAVQEHLEVQKDLLQAGVDSVVRL